MKFAVIDVGSNSVRLMYSNGFQTECKFVETTRLAQGMGADKLLKKESIKRTVDALSFFVNKARSEFVDDIFIFATAAVRQAVNKTDFLLLAKQTCGVDVEIISGEQEAKLGYVGALGGADGGVIDVGGASAEIIVVKNNVVVYSKSIELGAVKIFDRHGQDKRAVKEYVEKKIEEYGNIPNANFFAIGGTATSVAGMLLELEPYDANVVHGFKVIKNDLEELVDKLFAMSIEQRRRLKGLHPSRAEVIAGGAMVLLSLMNKLKIDSIVVSERDNLEGYLQLKMEKL